MADMIYCRVNVIMTAFTPSPTQGVPATVTATMEITGQTPNPSGDPYFHINGDSLIVKVPAGTPARIEYSLVNHTTSTDIFYIFGMFFTNPPPDVHVDETMFPLVLIAQGVPIQASMEGLDIYPRPYTVSVVDQNSSTGFWEYTIGIQDLNTAQIGLFDPGIENEQ